MARSTVFIGLMTVAGGIAGFLVAGEVDFGLHLEMAAWYLVPLLVLQIVGCIAVGAVIFYLVARKLSNLGIWSKGA